MKVQHDAARVLQRTSHYLKKGVISNKPMWYDAVGAYPAGMDLTKKPKVLEANQVGFDPVEKLFQRNDRGLFNTHSHSEDRRQKNNLVNRVAKIRLVEDELRNAFYHQHPWEFSRPKNLVESSGDENSKCDWSRMVQLHKPLDGESVVQRTLWLAKTEKKELLDAYDQARFEFYQLRMAEEMESFVGHEESIMFGGVFENTRLRAGLDREQGHVDRWAQSASEKTKIIDARSVKDEEATIWD